MVVRWIILGIWRAKFSDPESDIWMLMDIVLDRCALMSLLGSFIHSISIPH